MDVTALATALTGAQSAQTQIALAAKIMKMNAQAEASMAAMIEAAQQNAASLANVADGIGTNLNLSA
jgi:hypothetical protein